MGADLFLCDPHRVIVTGVTPSGGTTTVSLQIGANSGTARATAIRVADRLFLITQQGL